MGDLGSGIQPRAVDALLQLFSRSHKAIPAQPDLLTTDLVGLVWPGSWTPLFEQGGPWGTLAGGGGKVAYRERAEVSKHRNSSNLFHRTLARSL